MFCKNCGATLTENVKFCASCGAKVEHEQELPIQAPQAELQPRTTYDILPVQTPPAPVPVYARPAKKSFKGLIIALAVGLPVLAAAVLIFFFVIKPNMDMQNTPVGTLAVQATTVPKTDDTDRSAPAAEPEISYSYLSAKPEPVVTYEAEDKIFPSLYRTLDALVTLTAYCDNGESDVMVSVEIPGFTQAYKQKVTLTDNITKLRIVPPLLTGDLNLNSEKSAQLVLSVTEADSGKVLVQDSKSIKICSKYDMIWWTEEYGDMNTDNILAWMTPDAPKVLELKRDAVDYLEYISDGDINAMVGYQDYGYFDSYYNNTWVQAVAIQGAMSDIWQVRYNNASFSIDKDTQQRVMIPDDVISTRSGICIETALTMASALQSAGMHCMLIFPPGHAQVAVEAWPSTGDYFLIETTLLPMEQTMDAWNAAVSYMDKDEWQNYLDGYSWNSLGECYVLDCDLGQKLGIVPLSN